MFESKWFRGLIALVPMALLAMALTAPSGTLGVRG